MMTSDDKVGGWVKKGQNHDDVILEWSLIQKLLVWVSEKVSDNFWSMAVNISTSEKGIQRTKLTEYICDWQVGLLLVPHVLR